MNIDEKKTALIFKALCDENRVKILKLLYSGERIRTLTNRIRVTKSRSEIHHFKPNFLFSISKKFLNKKIHFLVKLYFYVNKRWTVLVISFKVFSRFSYTLI